MSHAEDAANALEQAGLRMISEIAALANQAAMYCDEAQALVHGAVGGTEAASESAALISGVLNKSEELTTLAYQAGMQLQGLAARYRSGGM